MALIDSLERLTELIPEPSPVASAKLLDRLDEQASEFIRHSPFLLLATDGAAGLDVSPKGDDPGFVEVVDAHTLLIPERPGNQLKMGLRNILANGRIGLIFLCPATGDAVRVSGRASLHDDPDLCQRLASHGRDAILVIKVDIERAFFHCPRAILRARLWKPETWGEPMRISLGKIIGKAMGKPEIAETIDTISDERNVDLWN
ncbi:MAG: MSMEG_1061 family FMN-dependent PPOX-type flavoprotein [Novosphingobium sp.]